MPMKEILHRLQPIQVYIVLVLSVLYFMVQMFISQKSQSITLLVHSYHTLCNIIALSGCIITLKHNDQETKRISNAESDSSVQFGEDQQQETQLQSLQQKDVVMNEKKKQQRQNATSLRNTFGWARVDVLTMVIVCTFLTSLCFSVVVEVIQSLFHITHKDHLDHQEEFHFYAYETCIILGALGLVLNGISYLLIGGYTAHQGSFLHLTSDGNVYILDRVVEDGRKISDSKDSKVERKSQHIHELSRDVCSAILVILCGAIIVFFGDRESILVRLVDPIFSLVSIALLLGLSYPYMKEAASILLQTIPDSIDIQDFQKQLLNKFPDIQSIHDLHIWQLTRQKFVSTAHIIFLNPSVYKTTINDVLNFFHEQGINIVTIQPEFTKLDDGTPCEVQKPLSDGMKSCLVACRQNDCEEKLCCAQASGSNESIELKSVHIEQVVSVKNVSVEELSDFTSAKSLNNSDSDSGHITKKRSSASLYNPTHRNNPKLQKAISAIDHDHQQISTVSTSNSSGEIGLMKVKKSVSESVIMKTSEQNSEILVENQMLKQLDTTDNNEMEDLYKKCEM